MNTVLLAGGPALVREAVARVIEGSRLVDAVERATEETRFGAPPRAGTRPDAILLVRTADGPRDRGEGPGADGRRAPGGSPTEGAEAVAAASAIAPTIVLGVADAPEADRCLRAGATGVLAADVTAVQLLAALETVLRGGLVVVLGAAPAPAVPGPRTAGAGVVGTLSLRERQVLTLLASGRGTPAIATALRISPLTVKTHIAHLLSKLGVSRRGHAIAFAYEHGFVVPGAGPAGTLLSHLPEAS